MPNDDTGGGGVPFQTYVDSQLAEVRRAAELALTSAGGAVPLQDFFDAILDEQRRGMLVAEQEREKAAQALAVTLAEQIRSGDRALREHIEQQIQQIHAALVAAESLEVARIDALAERLELYSSNGHAQFTSRLASVEQAAAQHVEQLRRERELVTTGQMQAIAKAEVATEKRFESVNEFRAQLADTISRFLPREVAEAQMFEVRKVADAALALAREADAKTAGGNAARAGVTSTATAWIAGLGLLVSVLAIAVVVILANAG